MELNEKLQQLRKQKGLTQEALADALFVSRTAISKWESGRGYPNIDSLKAIAKFYNITMDALLSGEELLTLAQEDTREKESHIRDRVFGLVDLSTMMLLFLPFFGQTAEGAVQGISLMALTEIAPYMKVLYYAFVAGIGVWGILTLVLQTWKQPLWLKSKHKVSLLLSALGGLLFVISLQPYAATFLFILTAIKVLMLVKWQ